MTHSGGKPHRVGDDLGQRYEIWCKDGDGNDICIGYSDSEAGFKSMVKLHPVWNSRRVIDRAALPSTDGSAK